MCYINPLGVSETSTTHDDEAVSDTSIHMRGLYSILLPKFTSLMTCIGWNSSVGMETRVRAGWPRNRGSDSRQGKEFFSSLQYPDRLWNRANLYNRYRGQFPSKAAGGVKLITHFHLVLRLRTRRAIPPVPHRSSWGGAKSMGTI
jgi:hypothetical protein